MELGPVCLEDVSAETQDSLARVTRQLRGMLRKKVSREMASELLEDAMDTAIKAATEDAVKYWKSTRTPCSAELFVRQCAEMLWYQFLQEDGKYTCLFVYPPPPRHCFASIF